MARTTRTTGRSAPGSTSCLRARTTSRCPPLCGRPSFASPRTAGSSRYPAPSVMPSRSSPPPAPSHTTWRSLPVSGIWSCCDAAARRPTRSATWCPMPFSRQSRWSTAATSRPSTATSPVHLGSASAARNSELIPRRGHRRCRTELDGEQRCVAAGGAVGDEPVGVGRGGTRRSLAPPVGGRQPGRRHGRCEGVLTELFELPCDPAGAPGPGRRCAPGARSGHGAPVSAALRRPGAHRELDAEGIGDGREPRVHHVLGFTRSGIPPTTGPGGAFKWGQGHR